MKKWLFSSIIALLLCSCIVHQDEQDDVPTTAEIIINSVNNAYLNGVMDQFDGFLEVLHFVETGSSDRVRAYRNRYELISSGAFYYQDRFDKDETPWWRCDPSNTNRPMLRFTQLDATCWRIDPVLETDDFHYIIRLEAPGSDTSFSLEAKGVRPDGRGPYCVEFQTEDAAPLQCKWISSQLVDQQRILLLSGRVSYRFCKEGQVLETYVRAYSF